MFRLEAPVSWCLPIITQERQKNKSETAKCRIHLEGVFSLPTRRPLDYWLCALSRHKHLAGQVEFEMEKSLVSFGPKICAHIHPMGNVGPREGSGFSFFFS